MHLFLGGENNNGHLYDGEKQVEFRSMKLEMVMVTMMVLGA